MAKPTPPSSLSTEDQEAWLKKAQSLSLEQQAASLKAKEKPLGKADASSDISESAPIAWESGLSGYAGAASSVPQTLAPRGTGTGSPTDATSHSADTVPQATPRGTAPANEVTHAFGGHDAPSPDPIGTRLGADSAATGGAGVHDPLVGTATHAAASAPALHAGNVANGGMGLTGSVVANTSSSSAGVAPTTPLKVSGTLTGSVGEDGALVASGTLTVAGGAPGARQWALGSPTGHYGSIDIDQSGQWHYHLDNSNRAVQALGAGHTATEHFIAFVTDADGQTRPVQLAITLTGTNDAAVVAGVDAGAVTEDHALKATGTLTIQDADTGEAHFQATDITSQFGALHLDAAGQWTYDLDNAAAQKLGAGNTATEVLTVHAADGTPHQITITVTGTNDLPVLSAQAQALTEDGTVLHGQLLATDIDSGDSLHFTTATPVPGFTLNANGSYSFDPADHAYQSLVAGEHRVLSIPITVNDATGGTDIRTLQITLTGTNDAPIIGGIDHATGRVAAGRVAIDGQLGVFDVDQGGSHFQTQILRGSYGVLNITADGHWHYTADASQPAVATMPAGAHLDETFTVLTVDGTRHDIVLKIAGNNVPAIFGGVSSGLALEDAPSTISHQLTVSDPNAGENAFTPVDQAEHYGHFTLAADGSWTYAVDNTNPQVQALAAGQSLTERITIGSVDGTPTVVTINIVGTNDAPLIGGVATGAVTEDQAVNGAGKLEASGQLSVVDVDAGESHFVAMQGIHGDHGLGSFSIDAAGHWTYTADNSQTAIQQLKAGDTPLTDRFTVTTADGTHHTITVSIGGLDDGAIVAGVDSGVVTEDHALQATGTLTIHDVDAGEAHFQATDITGQFGVLHFDAAGQWTYDLDNTVTQKLGAGETASEVMTVRAADGTPHQITVTVTGTNDAPVLLITPPQSVFEDVPPIHGRLAAIDVDVHDTLTYRATAPVAGFTIQPDGHYSFDSSDPAYDHLAFGQQQIVNIPVEVTDSSGGVASRTVQITVTGTNDAPTLTVMPPRNVDEGTTAIGGQLTATDPDSGDSLTFSLGQHVAGFTLQADGTYTFNPADPAYNYLPAGQKTIISVPVFVTDQHGGSDTQHLQITVTGTNDGAIVGGIDHAMGSVAAAQGGRVHIDGQLIAIDLDQGEAHFQSQLITGTYGTLEIHADGHWSYVADSTQAALANLPANGHLPEHFTVRTADGTTHDIDLQIKGANAPAIFAGVSAGMVHEDQPGSISHHLNVTDPNAGESAFQPQDQGTTYGHFTINVAGDWTYAVDNANPAVQALTQGQSLTESVLVGSVDGTPQMISVTILGTNDVAVIGGTHTGDVIEDSTDASGHLTASGQLTVTDPDAGQEHFIAMQGIPGDHGYGSFNIDAQGHWTYSADNSQPSIQTLKGGQTVTDSVTFMSADGTPQTLAVTVTGSNDGAVIAGTDHATIREDINADNSNHIVTTGLLTVTDVDSGEARFNMQLGVHGTGGYGNFIVTPNGHWTYTIISIDARIQSLGQGQHLTDTLEATSIDGTRHAISVTIEGSNDNPTVTAQTQSIAEDGGPLTGRMVAQDVDAGDTQTFSTTATIPGFTLLPDGSYTFDPSHADYQHLAAGESHPITIPITVTDAAGATATENLVINLTGTNDGAVIAGVDRGTVTEDTSVAATPGWHDAIHTSGTLTVSDADTGEAHFTPQTDVAGDHGYGHFTIMSNGTWLYHADNDDPKIQALGSGSPALTDSFVATSADGTHHTITVTIQGSNDAPTISAATQAATEDSVVHGQMHATDPDTGDHLSFSIATPVDGFTLNADGSYSFDATGAAYQSLAQGEHRDITIPVTVTDAAHATSTQNLVITLTGTDDAPVIGATSTAAASASRGPAMEITTGETQEDVHTSVTGTLHAHDVDHGDTLSFSVKGNAHGSYGDFHVDAATGTWTYTLHAGAQALKTGDTQHEAFTLVVTDAHGQSVEQVMTMTVKGSDDGSVIAGNLTGAVTEDTALTASGKLSISDVDAADHPGFVVHDASNPIHGTYGSLTLDAQGNWHYTLDNTLDAVQKLGVGAPALSDLISVQASDGSVQLIHISVAGTNDAPTVSASTVDLVATAEGTPRTYVEAKLLELVGAKDIDDTLSITSIAVDPQYGSFARQTGSGGLSQWVFTPTAGAHHDDIPLTLTISDGHVTTTAHAQLDITPSLMTGALTGSAVEDTATTITGDLISPTAGTALHLGDHTMAGTYGSLDLRDGGHWVYTLHNAAAGVQGLKAGEIHTEHFSVQGPGGVAQDIAITVAGTHDAPVISVPTAAQQTIGAVTVVHELTAATDLSSFTAVQAGVAVGHKIVGLYMPGSSVNELAGIAPDELPSTHSAYSNVDSAGYQFLTGNAWFEHHLTGGATRFAAVAPSIRNTWDGGLIVFGDGSVGRLIKVCDDTRPGEHDYVYFNLIPGANALHGLTQLTGNGTAGSQVEVFEGTTSLGHATVGADGHWAFTVPHTLNDGDHVLHTISGGVQSALMHAQVSSGVATLSVETPSIGSITEDAAQASISGQLSVTDADMGDNPVFTVQAATAGHYGSFQIDAQGHWHYTLDNSLTATQALAAGTQRIENFHVEVTTASGEHVSRDVTVTVQGSNDGPTLVAGDTSHAANLGTMAEDAAPRTFTQADLLHLVGATDTDGDTLSISAVQVAAQYGSFAHQPNGDWLFTPAANAHHADIPLTLTVSDGHATTMAHAQLDLTPVTDAASAHLHVVAEQHVMEFHAGLAGAIQHAGSLQTHGDLTSLAIELTVLGSTQVATAGIHGATLVSYAASASDLNTFYIWRPENLTVRVDGHEYETHVNMGSDADSHRWSFLWDSTHGTLDILKDGHSVAHLDNVAQGAHIAGGGKLAFGNDQDSLGGGYSVEDGWHGRMFSATAATGVSGPAALAQQALRDAVHGDALFLDIQAQAGHMVDTTGHHTVESLGGVTTPAVMVDTSIANPAPGALLHLNPSIAAPSDPDDHITAVHIGGFVTGTVLDDHHGHTHTVSGHGDVVDIQGWTTADLTAQLPANTHANMRIGLEVITTGPDGTTQASTASTPLLLDPLQPIPDAIIGGADSLSTDEDSAVSGVLTVTDPTAAQSHFITQTDTDGHYGKFNLTADGHWTYTPDNRADALAAGAHATEQFTVTSADGTSHQVAVALTGSNNGAVITGTDSGTVTEDTSVAPTPGMHDAIHTTGKLTVSDADTGEDHFALQSDVAGDHGYGHFTILPDGTWLFHANNDDARIQGLGVNQHLTDTVLVSSADGTQHTITVTIQGSNDGPVVTASAAAPANLGTTTEDAPKTFTEADLLRLVGASDVDHDTLHVSSVTVDATAGAFAKQSDGSWVFTPAPNFQGSHLPVSLVVSDGHLDTTAHALMDVTPVADKPVLGISLGAGISLLSANLATEVAVMEGKAYGGDLSTDFPGVFGPPALMGDPASLAHVIGIRVGGTLLQLGGVVDPSNGYGRYVLGAESCNGFLDNPGDGSVKLVLDDAAPTVMKFSVRYLDEGPNAVTYVDEVASWKEFTIDRGAGSSGGGGGGAAAGADHFTANVFEDQDIPLVVTLSDPDSSEHLAVTIAGMPAGAALSAGTHNTDGTWSLTPAQLSGLHMTPPQDFKGDVHLTVTATSTDHTDTAHTTFNLDLSFKPVAEAPHLQATDPHVADEAVGTPIALDVQLDVHHDASEKVSLQVVGIPNGATLSAGSKNADGTWTLQPADLHGLTVTPAAHWSGTMTLRVIATSAEQTGESASATASLSVHVNPVIDMHLSGHDLTLTQGDAFSLSQLMQITQPDSGESATFTFRVPSSWTLSGGTHVVEGVTGDAAIKEYHVPLADLATAQFHPPVDYHGTQQITLHAVVTENGLSQPVNLPVSLTVQVPLAAVAAVSVATTFTGATDLGGLHESITGVAGGLKIVGFYLPGSDVNQLAGMDATHLPHVIEGYSSDNPSGFQYLREAHWLSQNMPAHATDFPRDGANPWANGLVVFEDGTVGRLQKLSDGNSYEYGRMYFTVVDGINAHQEMTHLQGTAAPNTQLEIFDSQTSLGQVTVGADGHWSLVTPHAMVDGNHPIHIVTAGVAFPVQDIHVQAGAASVAAPAGSADATDATIAADFTAHTDTLANAGEAFHVDVQPVLTAAGSGDHLDVRISLLPDGSVVSDGVHSETVSATNPGVNISGWHFDALVVTPPADQTDSYVFDIKARPADDATAKWSMHEVQVDLHHGAGLPNAVVSGDDRASTDEHGSVSGVLTVSDADAGQAHFHAAAMQGDYGSLNVDEAGHWTYATNDHTDALASGEHVADHFGVTTADGTVHQIVIGVTGTDDLPVDAHAAAAPVDAYMQLVAAAPHDLAVDASVHTDTALDVYFSAAGVAADGLQHDAGLAMPPTELLLDMHPADAATGSTHTADATPVDDHALALDTTHLHDLTPLDDPQHHVI